MPVCEKLTYLFTVEKAQSPQASLEREGSGQIHYQDWFIWPQQNQYFVCFYVWNSQSWLKPWVTSKWTCVRHWRFHWHALFSQILHFKDETLGFGQQFPALKPIINARDLKSMNDYPSSRDLMRSNASLPSTKHRVWCFVVNCMWSNRKPNKQRERSYHDEPPSTRTLWFAF